MQYRNCQVSVERIVLDLESEVVRGLGSNPTGGNILSLNFFHIVKPLMPILPLLQILSIECLDHNRICFHVYKFNFFHFLLQQRYIFIVSVNVPENPW